MRPRPLLHRYINSESVVAPGALIPHHNLFSAFCRLRFKLKREYRIVPVTVRIEGKKAMNNGIPCICTQREIVRIARGGF